MPECLRPQGFLTSPFILNNSAPFNVVIHPTELTVKTVLDNEDDYKYAAKNGTANAIRKYQLNYNYEDS